MCVIVTDLYPSNIQPGDTNHFKSQWDAWAGIPGSTPETATLLNSYDGIHPLHSPLIDRKKLEANRGLSRFRADIAGEWAGWRRVFWKDPMTARRMFWILDLSGNRLHLHHEIIHVYPWV